MSTAYSSAPVSSYDPVSAGVVPEDVHGVALNWFPNRHPLYTRFRNGTVGSETFKFSNERFRPRSVRLTANAADNATAITVDDASIVEVDDVLKVDDEYLLVTATAGTAPGNLTVARGYAGTTAAAHTAGSSPNQLKVHLITNTRTGYQEDVAAMSRTHEAFTQVVQTVMTSYAVGGRAEALSNYQGGAFTPLAREKMAALERALDQFESGLYRGKKVTLTSATARPMQAGLEQLIVTNKTTSPTNASAYTPVDLIRDTFQKILDAGGQPTHMLVSTDWMAGFYKWGVPSVRTDVATTTLGVKVTGFTVPFMQDVQGIIAPLLPPGTLAMLSEPEVEIRMLRQLHDKPRGSHGDAFRGDVIMDGAIELENEAHHAWLTGVTGFSVNTNRPPPGRKPSPGGPQHESEAPAMSRYTFIGIPDHVDAAADKAGLTDPEYRRWARSGLHARAVADALSQLPHQAENFGAETVAEVRARVDLILKSHAVQHEALKAAVSEVFDAVAPKPTKPKRTNKEAGS